MSKKILSEEEVKALILKNNPALGKTLKDIPLSSSIRDGLEQPNSSSANIESGQLNSPRGALAVQPSLLEDTNFNSKEDPDISFDSLLESRPSLDDYYALDFQNPAEMLLYFNQTLRDSIIKLHPWQAETLAFLGSRTFTKDNPCKLLLDACNGSGKDAYIIAPFALWLCLCKKRSRFIGTSSSFTQLHLQTESYIRSLATLINNSVGGELLAIKQCHIIGRKSGSEIKLFVTDDPGRAEGYHPFPDYPNAEMAIVVNEAKSVEDPIFNALKRCTGYNYWIEVSSTGVMKGHHYSVMLQALNWSLPLLRTYKGGPFIHRKITAYDCPHISKQEIESAKQELGEFSPLFRSMYLSEYTSESESLILTNEAIRKCIANKPDKIEACEELPLRAGLDLAKGGDEEVLTVYRGNYHVGTKSFQSSDITVTADILIEFFREFGFTPENCYNIYADDGGIGAGTLDIIARNGWEISRVKNQSKASNPRIYGNRGAEMWYSLKRLVEESAIILPEKDTRLLHQLSSRYYSQPGNQGRIILESKKEARAKGHSSPDRADSLVLANCRVNIKTMREIVEGVLVNNPNPSLGALAGEALYASFYSNPHLFKQQQSKQKAERGNSLLCLLGN